MSQSTFLKRSVSSVAIACGALCAAMPAAADPIDWASWSGVVTSATSTGSALATFADLGMTASYTGELRSFVPNYPSYAPVATFSGGTVSNRPAQSDGIVQIFGGANTGTHTITFSQAVLNPVMAIWSLGQPGFNAQFVFGQSFTIQSGGPNAEFGGATITAAGNTVSGLEGSGVIQFDGSLTSITWTNPVFENWYGFTVGVPLANPIPEPETYALLLAGLALVGASARRRRNAG
jgi:PEP-CTERM motif